MENTNVTPSAGKMGGKPFVIGLIMLILGVLIGVVATKYARHGFSSARDHDASGAASSGPASITAGSLFPSAEWNPYRELREMQADMDQIFQRSLARFRSIPKLNVFQEEPGYSLSLDVRDLKDRYEIRAFLPDTKVSDVKVKLDGNLLKVNMANQTTEKQTGTNSVSTMTELGQYEQVVQLAGPLKADQMNIERKEHELIITVPKA